MKCFWKKNDDLNYFDLKGTNIKNSEPYYDGLYGDDDLVSKRHVDELNGKQDIAVNDKLSKEANKGSDRMDADLYINNKKIVNVGYTTWNQDGDAINYRIFHQMRGELKRQINGVSEQADDALSLDDGTKPMAGNLDMNNKKLPTSLLTQLTNNLRSTGLWCTISAKIRCCKFSILLFNFLLFFTIQH